MLSQLLRKAYFPSLTRSWVQSAPKVTFATSRVNGYLCFCHDKRDAVKAEDSTLSFVGLTQKLASMWKKLPLAEQEKYKAKAIEYNLNVRNGIIPPVEKPKRRISAFINFSLAHRQSIRAANPELTLGGASKLLGEQWRNFSPEERERWVSPAKK